MRYTNYFGLVTREHGQLNLPDHQFQKMMNIIHIEGVIEGMERIKKDLPDDLKYKFNLQVVSMERGLKMLTDDLESSELMRGMNKV